MMMSQLDCRLLYRSGATRGIQLYGAGVVQKGWSAYTQRPECSAHVHACVCVCVCVVQEGWSAYTHALSAVHICVCVWTVECGGIF